MTNVSQASLSQFGFKFGQSGAHSARSMMLAELVTLFEGLPEDASKEAYQSDICDHNVLNKPTAKSRNLTFRHLVDLYSLDPAVPLFRMMRRLWPLDASAQPVLALQMSLARDPLLRLSLEHIMETPPGEAVARGDIENILKAPDPDRFSAASLKSFAQNINGSWTQAGFLKGRSRKVRSRPQASYTNLVFALFQAYLEGATGERLFESKWCRLLDRPQDDLEDLAVVAAQRGVIDYRQSGGVIDVRFPGFLTADEEQWRYE